MNQPGWDVVITGRNAKALEEACSSRASISYVVADASSSDAATAAVTATAERHGRLDVRVDNAGIAPPAPLADTTDEHVDAILGTNVRGVVSTTRAALPLLDESGGRVINVSSALAQRPLPGMSVYAASKAALSSRTKSWARELATEGIRVNAVNPGPIATPLFDKLEMPEADAHAMAKQITRMVWMQRFGQADEVASVVSFLASDASRFVTGSEHLVDGGFGS